MTVTMVMVPSEHALAAFVFETLTTQMTVTMVMIPCEHALAAFVTLHK